MNAERNFLDPRPDPPAPRYTPAVALTKAEMRAYSERVAKMLGWMVRARKRLEVRMELGEIHRLTTDAENALHALRIKSHYAACDPVGKTKDTQLHPAQKVVAPPAKV